MRSVGTKRVKLPLKRAPRTGIALSTDFLIQPATRVASLVPSLREVSQIRVNHGMGARPSAGGRSLLLFQDTIDTATTDPNQLCDLLFVVSLSKQLPDLLVDSHPLAMTTATLLFGFVGNFGSGSRTSCSCRVSHCLFEHTCFGTKELLQSFGKVLL